MEYSNRLERTAPEQVGLDSRGVLAYLDYLERSGTEMHGLMILRRLLNPTAPTSDAAAMAAITAGAKRGSRTDVRIVSVIDALKP